MDVLLPFIILLTLGLALLGALAARTYNQTAHGAITRYFQDAEYILQHQRPPPRWRTRFLRPRKCRSLRILLPRRAILRIAGRRSSDQQRLAALIAYFERSSFVEDEETRAELLRQLRAAGARWQDETTSPAARPLTEAE